MFGGNEVPFSTGEKLMVFGGNEVPISTGKRLMVFGGNEVPFWDNEFSFGVKIPCWDIHSSLWFHEWVFISLGDRNFFETTVDSPPGNWSV